MISNDIYLNDTWTSVMNTIKEAQLIPDYTLEFFKGELVSLDDIFATIKVPMFINRKIMSDNRQIIENCLEETTGHKFSVKFVEESEYDRQKERLQYVNNFASMNINDKQTFDNFVVGNSNRQAQLASLNCAKNPGKDLNPLLIYGESGLGKTHLLNAIGNRIIELYPDLNIGMINSGDFVEGVYKSSTEDRFAEFKDVFRKLDVLLVDDIQFIAGKPKTQELFFSVFNELINDHKQICITSDRYPEDIKDMESRLITRFTQGLNINIEAPEYETALSILKMEISNNTDSNYGIDDIDEDVYGFLANNFSSNVRSLQGALKRLLFYSVNFSRQEEKGRITLRLATEAFRDHIKTDDAGPSIISVRKAVCEYYNLTKQQIISKNRTKNISNARQIAMYLCRKYTNATYEEIGREFGGRNHATVLSACEVIDDKIKTSPIYTKAVSEIESLIK